MIFVPASPSRFTPRAVIFSPVIPTSPTKVPAGVTTFPPLMIRSKRTEPLALPSSLFPLPAFLLGNGCQCPIEHVDGEIRVFGGDAHRWLGPQHVALEAALAN